MPLQIEKVQVGDLVKELSREALRYFAALQLSDEWEPLDSPLRGSFVRLGRVILIGAGIDYGPADYLGLHHTLRHEDMLKFATTELDEDAQTRIEKSAPRDGQYLKGKWPLVDAGRTFIRLDQEGTPAELVMGQSSIDFGRADDQTRQDTGEIARQLLGSEIPVTLK